MEYSCQRDNLDSFLLFKYPPSCPSFDIRADRAFSMHTNSTQQVVQLVFWWHATLKTNSENSTQKNSYIDDSHDPEGVGNVGHHLSVGVEVDTGHVVHMSACELVPQMP